MVAIPLALIFRFVSIPNYFSKVLTLYCAYKIIITVVVAAISTKSTQNSREDMRFNRSLITSYPLHHQQHLHLREYI